MRQKKLSLIITFAATADAMEMERYAMAHQLSGRLIPVPGAIRAGCGLAWKTTPEAREQTLAAMADAGLRWEAAELLEMWE